jgi:hypothetical protein
MSDITLRISGLKEAAAALRDMGTKAKPIVRKGLRIGAKIIQATERAFAPKRSGRLGRAIQISGGKSSTPGMVTLTVDPKRKSFKGVYYAPFVVNDHRTRGGKRVIAGRDFPLRAFETKQVQAAQAAADYIEQNTTI